MIEGKIGFVRLVSHTSGTGSPWFSRTSRYYTDILFTRPSALSISQGEHPGTFSPPYVAPQYANSSILLRHAVKLHYRITYKFISFSFASFLPSFHPSILQTYFPHHAPIAAYDRARTTFSDFYVSAFPIFIDLGNTRNSRKLIRELYAPRAYVFLSSRESRSFNTHVRSMQTTIDRCNNFPINRNRSLRWLYAIWGKAVDVGCLSRVSIHSLEDISLASSRLRRSKELAQRRADWLIFGKYARQSAMSAIDPLLFAFKLHPSVFH